MEVADTCQTPPKWCLQHLVKLNQRCSCQNCVAVVIDWGILGRESSPKVTFLLASLTKGILYQGNSLPFSCSNAQSLFLFKLIMCCSLFLLLQSRCQPDPGQGCLEDTEVSILRSADKGSNPTSWVSFSVNLKSPWQLPIWDLHKRHLFPCITKAANGYDF